MKFGIFAERLKYKGEIGWWWLSSDDGDGNARDVNNDGSRNYNYADKRNGAVRPDSLLMGLFPEK